MTSKPGLDPGNKDELRDSEGLSLVKLQQRDTEGVKNCDQEKAQVRRGSCKKEGGVRVGAGREIKGTPASPPPHPPSGPSA